MQLDVNTSKLPSSLELNEYIYRVIKSHTQDRHKIFPAKFLVRPA